MIGSKDLAKKHRNVGQVDLDLFIGPKCALPCMEPYPSVIRAI